MSILLFDGVCNLCHGFVRFILARDPAERFTFASLQSEAGRRLLREHGLSEDGDPTSVVLIEEGRAFTRADAVLRIVRQLGGLWPVFGVFRIVPPGLRNGIYAWVARNRYHWFGKQPQCRIPEGRHAKRFLDTPPQGGGAL